MSATFNELLDAGLCTGGCLLAVPKTFCDCRCQGWLHGWLVEWLNRRHEGFAEFPGFPDIDIIQKGKGLRALDPQHEAGGWWGRRTA